MKRTDTTEQHERGASLVEFALVLPILAAFLLGTLSAGLAYNRNNSLNNAARESARYAATLPVDGSMSAWLTSVAAVAESAASGDLDDGVAGQYVCVAYVHPNGTDADDQTTRLTETAGVQSTAVGSTCFTDGRPDSERRVQIQVQRDTDIEVVLFSSTVTLDGESVVRFERAD